MNKKLIITILVTFIFSFLPGITFAGSAVLSWQANSEPDIAYYNIYYGTLSRSYSSPIPVGKITTYTINNLDEGKKYYFAVTALDTSGNESGYSTEVSKIISSPPPPQSGSSFQVSLWWTEYANRSTSVPVKIYDGTTLLDTIRVNQKANGGKWNELGTYNFSNKPKITVVSEGNNLSTCADAVRLISNTGSSIYIDNRDPNTSKSGSWRNSGGKNPYDGSSLYSKQAGAQYTFEKSSSEPSFQVSLWWTEYANRSTSVPVKIYDGTTLLDTIRVNQKANGGKWNELGTYNFSNKPKIIVVSEGNNLSTCADAVRLVSSTGSKIYLDNGDLSTSKSGSWRKSGGINPYDGSSLYSKQAGAQYTFEKEM